MRRPPAQACRLPARKLKFVPNYCLSKFTQSRLIPARQRLWSPLRGLRLAGGLPITRIAEVWTIAPIGVRLVKWGWVVVGCIVWVVAAKTTVAAVASVATIATVGTVATVPR